MAFGYNPQDANRVCLPAGTYDAELTSVAEKKSKAGADMLEVIWTVPFNGKDVKVRDFIVNPSTLFKLKGIAKAWEMIQEFEESRFDLADHIRRQIVLKLSVETNGSYGDQNSVVGYLAASGQMPPRPAETQPATVGDAHEGPAEHIPF